MLCFLEWSVLADHYYLVWSTSTLNHVARICAMTQKPQVSKGTPVHTHTHTLNPGLPYGGQGPSYQSQPLPALQGAN